MTRPKPPKRSPLTEPDRKPDPMRDREVPEPDTNPGPGPGEGPRPEPGPGPGQAPHPEPGPQPGPRPDPGPTAFARLTGGVTRRQLVGGLAAAVLIALIGWTNCGPGAPIPAPYLGRREIPRLAGSVAPPGSRSARNLPWGVT